jgi:mannose-6-phosphate isomerase-like protein (cupin superfamily)
MMPSEWVSINGDLIPSIDPKYFRSETVKDGYIVYDLITGNETDGKWSAALLEIRDSPRHSHTISTEVFVVMNGVLDMEMEGENRRLKAGEAIRVVPGTIHKLKSANENPVRVLCLNFPAFDPNDMNL